MHACILLHVCIEALHVLHKGNGALLQVYNIIILVILGQGCCNFTAEPTDGAEARH